MKCLVTVKSDVCNHCSSRMRVPSIVWHLRTVTLRLGPTSELGKFYCVILSWVKVRNWLAMMVLWDNSFSPNRVIVTFTGRELSKVLPTSHFELGGRVVEIFSGFDETFGRGKESCLLIEGNSIQWIRPHIRVLFGCTKALFALIKLKRCIPMITIPDSLDNSGMLYWPIMGIRSPWFFVCLEALPCKSPGFGKRTVSALTFAQLCFNRAFTIFELK